LLQREHALTRDPAALAIASRWKKRAKQAKRTEENSWLRSRKDRLRVLKTLGEADKILDELRPYLASDWTLPIVQVRQGVGKHETWQRVKISEVLGGGILLRVADWVKRRKSPVARGRPQKVYVLNCALDLASYFYQKTNRCHWRAVGEIVQKYFRASGSLDPEARVRQLVKGWAARYRRDYDAALQEKAEQEELDGAENHGRRPKQSLLRNRTVLNWRPRLDPMPPAKQKVIEMLTNRPAPEPLPAYLLPYFERL
jgi:hypothetical protein